MDREAAVGAVLKSVIASPVIGYRAPLLVDDTDVFADVELQQKDLVLAQELARRLGAAVPTCAAASEMLSAARSSRSAGRDFVVSVARGLPPNGRDGMMPEPYRTTIDEVPLERGLREDEGWIDMQVQFLIDERTAGSEHARRGPHGPAARRAARASPPPELQRVPGRHERVG